VHLRKINASNKKLPQNKTAGLPDSLFSNQKSKFWYILEGPAMEDVGIFYVLLVHFTVL
jgi:hypothetical protein